jgi:hypothetical protein
VSSLLSLRLAWLYPTLLNVYGDRGNVIALRHRCALRGIRLDVIEIGLKEPFVPEAYDLIFIGGGQDKEQRIVARDLEGEKGAAIRAAVEAGMPALAVCGGYELFGHYYREAGGSELRGISVFDLHTVHPGEGARRCIGNLAVEWAGGVAVGFENHGGRVYLGEGVRPWAKVLAGFGNNGEDGGEGAVYNNAYGTFLHVVLPKNPTFADHLIQLALHRKYGACYTLPPSPDDRYEQRAHEEALAIALGRRA